MPSPVPPVAEARNSKIHQVAEAIYPEPGPALSPLPSEDSSKLSTLAEDDSLEVSAPFLPKRRGPSTRAALKRRRPLTQDTKPELDPVIQESVMTNQTTAGANDKPKKVKVTRRKEKLQSVEEGVVRENPGPNPRRTRREMNQASEGGLMMPIEQVLEDAGKLAETRGKRKRNPAEKPATEDGFNVASDSDDPKPNKRRIRRRPQLVYDIPDVVRKTTTFRGAL